MFRVFVGKFYRLKFVENQNDTTMTTLMTFAEYLVSRNNVRDLFYTSWADEYEAYVYRNS